MRTDYEQIAGRYDEDRAEWSYPPDDVVAELSRGAAVLDLGCGTGRWLVAQRDADVMLVGADPSDGMLAEARAKGLANLVRARSEELPFPDATFAYAVASYCVHHFTDKERALDEIARVLRSDGGVFRINNIEPTAADGWWVYEFFPETVAIDVERFWSPPRTTDALEARGFTVDVQIDTGTQEIAADHVLADAERRVISQLAVLDDAAYTRGLERVRQVAATPRATVTAATARICLTARRP